MHSWRPIILVSCQRNVENTYEHTWCLRTRDKFADLYECPQEVSRDFNITLDTSGRNTIKWCQPYWYRLITSSQKAKYHFNVPNQSSYNLCRTNTTSSWRRFIQVTCHGCELHCVLVWATYRTQERELPKHFLSKNTPRWTDMCTEANISYKRWKPSTQTCLQNSLRYSACDLDRWLCLLVDSFRIEEAPHWGCQPLDVIKCLLTQSTTRQSNYFRICCRRERYNCCTKSDGEHTVCP